MSDDPFDFKTPPSKRVTTHTFYARADAMSWIDTVGYRLCWGSGRFAALWSRVWYRYRCPYPVIPDHSARACVDGGHCGCDNGPRLTGGLMQ